MKLMEKALESGQIVVVLLLTILVGLSIGLVVTQRTITDVTTSTQTEQSSRAFSAAEAGLERALSGTDNVQFDLTENNSSAKVEVNASLPNSGQALEYLKPIDKGTTAQFWLANPDDLTEVYPAGAALDLYFGNENEPLDSDIPAIEVTMIYYQTGGAGRYVSSKRYFDSNQLSRGSQNGISEGCEPINPLINTTNSATDQPDRKFRCRVALTTPASPNKAIMVRARILYSNTPQRIALNPLNGNSLPVQASIYYSTGKSGQSQKLITYFKLRKVLPSFLDFAIFSNADINK